MGLFSRKKRDRTDDPTLADLADPDLAANLAAHLTSGRHADEEAVRDPDQDDLQDPGPDTDGGSSALDEFARLVDREWDRLARPGTWWNGGERIAIATDARRAGAGVELSGVLPAPVEEVTRRVAADAAGIRAVDIARWESAGLDPFAYVEIVGIVSRLLALDVAALGLGQVPRPLPEPRPGEPTRHKPDGAAVTTGWAPTVGPASAPSSLSAVPAEADGMWDLHGVLYLPLDAMFDMQIELDGLSRPQIELVAARTSALNDCFY